MKYFTADMIKRHRSVMSTLDDPTEKQYNEVVDEWQKKKQAYWDQQNSLLGKLPPSVPLFRDNTMCLHDASIDQFTIFNRNSKILTFILNTNNLDKDYFLYILRYKLYDSYDLNAIKVTLCSKNNDSKIINSYYKPPDRTWLLYDEWDIVKDNVFGHYLLLENENHFAEVNILFSEFDFSYINYKEKDILESKPLLFAD